jgi:nucleotide-binding universal stress UspA family protein
MPDKKPLLVATDGSDHSLRVLPHADNLARHLGAGLEFVRVVEREEVVQEPGETEAAATERACNRVAIALADDLARFEIAGNARCIVAREGQDTGSALLAEAAGAQIIAMHSRGRGGLSRLLHGSVALAVLKQASQPVLLGGPELLPPPKTDPYRLLVTTDLSTDSERCLKAIAPLIEGTGIQATLLYVHFHAPAGIDNEAERARHEAELAQKRLLLPASTDVQPVLREIPVGAGVDTAIMEVADQVGAAAIAMSTHGASARHHIVMGSVAMSILGRSRLPLIVVRAQD